MIMQSDNAITQCCSVIVFTVTLARSHARTRALANQASAIYVADTLIATFTLRSANASRYETGCFISTQYRFIRHLVIRRGQIKPRPGRSGCRAKPRGWALPAG